MDKHFHLPARVLRRREGFDVPLEVLLARFDRTPGVECAKLMHRNPEF